MNKPLKYILIVVIIGLLGYKSVYLKKLSEVNKPAGEKFDAEIFTRKLWDEKMPAKIDGAVELATLIRQIATDKTAAFKKYSNALGIGNYRYTLVHTSATVTAANDDEVAIQVTVADSIVNAVLAMEYIYGNAVRDASGLIALNDFYSSSDLNNISEAFNRIVKNTVLPPFKKAVKKGDKLDIVAATELNAEHIAWNGLELLPVRLKINN